MMNCLKCANRGALTLVFVLFFGVIIQGVGAQTQPRSFELMEATIPQLQAALATGTITSRDLVTMYLARIEAYDQRGPALNAISVTNPKALAEADALDAERGAGTLRGPLHGIPIVEFAGIKPE
jgi:amidase